MDPLPIQHLTFKDISEKEVEVLAEAHESARVRTLLGMIMGVPQSQGNQWTMEDDSEIYGKVPESRWDILIDEYFFAFNYCKEMGYSKPVVSAFLGIIKRVLTTDINGIAPAPLAEDAPALVHEACSGASIKSTIGGSRDDKLVASFKHFKILLLTHCCDWPPHAFKVFSKEEGQSLLSYFTSTYYRHFKLFHYNFGKHKATMLMNKEPSSESPKEPRPLSQSMYSALPANEPSTGSLIHSSSEPVLQGDTSADGDKTSRRNSVVSESKATRVSAGGSATNAARSLKRQAGPASKKRGKLVVSKDAEVRWQVKWTSQAKVSFANLSTDISAQIEAAFLQKKDSEIHLTVDEKSFRYPSGVTPLFSIDKLDRPNRNRQVETDPSSSQELSQERPVTDSGPSFAEPAEAAAIVSRSGTIRLYKHVANCLVHPGSGETFELKRDLYCRERFLREEGQAAKKVTREIATLAFESVKGAFAAVFDAEKWAKKAKVRRSCESARLKVWLKYKEAQARLRQKRIIDIQARVEELMGMDAKLVSVKLVDRKVEMKQAIQFEGGAATIKAVSHDLVAQIAVALKAIDQTCDEYHIPRLHFQVEGHTAPSKKTTDGGKGTSQARALAVCTRLGEDGTPRQLLHAVGWGSSKPPTTGDPRRVEILVLDDHGLVRLQASGEEVH